jgi:predicted nucleotidyltransferase
MTDDASEKLRLCQSVVTGIVRCLRDYHPKTALLFGSLARLLAGSTVDHFPRDIDILVVGSNMPFELIQRKYAHPVELHYYRTEEMVGVARCLRYDSKPVAMARLYGRNVIKGHARDVIAACLLLGPGYADFGIEQIEIDGRVDTRDYAVHQVLLGESWWQRLSTYARQRRGPLGRLTDKLAGTYAFE